jgi:diaminohydroxyphosphoribosylaminopyrimidine deaminase/5-amino-6-(5-phosphoribosylamino)uracil reductase
MTGLPYVVLKAAVSLDGKIATRTGESKWITGDAARDDARLERSLCDAVIVGAGTVAADDPELAPHGKFKKKKLLRVIIDGELSSDVKKKVFRDNNVLVACADSASKKHVERFKKNKIKIATAEAGSRHTGGKIKSFGKERVSIQKLLEYLGKRGVQKVFVEGGAGVHGAFYDEAMRKTQDTNSKKQTIVDEMIFYIAPKIIGGKNAVAAIGGEGVKRLSDVLELKDVKTEPVGNDLKVRGIVNWY